MEPYLKAVPFFGYHETRIWLPTGEKYEDDPCNGRKCSECEIGGCEGKVS
jgi:hypothetical protein